MSDQRSRSEHTEVVIAAACRTSSGCRCTSLSISGYRGGLPGSTPIADCSRGGLCVECVVIGEGVDNRTHACASGHCVAACQCQCPVHHPPISPAVPAEPEPLAIVAVAMRGGRSRCSRCGGSPACVDGSSGAEALIIGERVGQGRSTRRLGGAWGHCRRGRGRPGRLLLRPRVKGGRKGGTSSSCRCSWAAGHVLSPRVGHGGSGIGSCDGDSGRGIRNDGIGIRLGAGSSLGRPSTL